VIELSGVLDRSAAESLAAAIDDAIESGVPAITVDLRGVERIDRHGTHALLVGHLRAGDCDVVLSIVPGGPAVMRVLDRVDAPFRYR
jgi:anti-anti-sigma regulatory factor